MNYVLIIHEVQDYAVWKEGFDQAANQRRMAGELEFQVLRYEQTENKVVHYSKWKSMESARQFFESREIAELREQLGVKKPEFIYLSELESGIL